MDYEIEFPHIPLDFFRSEKVREQSNDRRLFKTSADERDLFFNPPDPRDHPQLLLF